MRRKYKPGDDVIPKVEGKEKSLRERRVEDADRRLMEEVRDISLREAGVESSEARRERRRREERLQSRAISSRDNSADNRSNDDTERRRRREAESERRRARDDTALRPATAGTEDRRRRRSNEERSGPERRARQDASEPSMARRIEHQSSLRSLISSSDADSREMEAEILRQIREEGLLDGIDLENIDVSQEDQISERIAQAFQRRQEEISSGQTSSRRTGTGERHRRVRSSAPDSREASGDDSGRSRRTRTHSRSPSAIVVGETVSRPPQAPSASQATHLETQPTGERRRRRTSSASRSSTTPIPSAVSENRPAARSQTDLSNRPQSAYAATSRPLISANQRSTTDPSLRAVELPASDPSPSESRPSQNSSPRIRSTGQFAAPDLPPRELPAQTTSNSSPRIPSTSRMEELPASNSTERRIRSTSAAELPSNQDPRVPSGSRTEELPASTGMSERRTRVAPATETPSNSSPRIPSTSRMEELPAQKGPSERKTRAAPPAAISVSAASPSPPTSPVDRSLLPPPLSPRDPSRTSLSDRAGAISSGSRPSSSSSVGSKSRPQLYPEPSLTCAKCSKTHIEYELHYNCGKCWGGNYNICMSCYRTGAGCLHWFGFGYAAWNKWENLKNSGALKNPERPHMLTANRYIPPKQTAGGADGRKTLTTSDPQNRLQSGAFCASCLAWANECYWRCDSCNEGDWGFCNICVNQGRSCTHDLLPLTYKPSESYSPSLSATRDQQTPPSAKILTGPGVIDVGPFKPLTFSTTCDICHYPIQPSNTRYHCFSCVSKVPNTLPGDYDICKSCYPKLISSRRISAENGHAGWRRCLQGHRMVIVGFEDNHGGQRRVVVSDLVGGRGLLEESTVITDATGSELMQWRWDIAPHSKVKLVTKDVMKTAPTSVPNLVIEPSFPPNGGLGMNATALWSWYPAEGVKDELMFPKGAEVREGRNVNEDWFWGVYMGQKGLFPAPYVRNV